MIVVEVLGRRGEVLQRERVNLPATIGRAWSNDIMIADPTVDPQHARISVAEDGAIVIEDLGTVNGLHAGASKERVPRIVLNGVTTVRAGRTSLRIARADQPVPPAVPDLAPTGRLASLLSSPAAMAAVIAGGIALIVLSFWLESYDAKAGSGVQGQVLGFAGLIAGWTGVWAIIGRIRAQQFLFWQHATLTCLAVVVALLVGDAGGYLDFLFPAHGTASVLVTLIEAVIVVALITAELGLVGSARRGRRVALAALITGALAIIVIVSAKAAKDESTTVAISTTLEPLPESVIPAGTVDDFMKLTAGLKKDVDSEKVVP